MDLVTSSNHEDHLLIEFNQTHVLNKMVSGEEVNLESIKLHTKLNLKARLRHHPWTSKCRKRSESLRLQTLPASTISLAQTRIANLHINRQRLLLVLPLMSTMHAPLEPLARIESVPVDILLLLRRLRIKRRWIANSFPTAQIHDVLSGIRQCHYVATVLIVQLLTASLPTQKSCASSTPA
jgi:hypothetical protein